MTNSFTDMKNSRVILIGGNNTAECHPLAMRWVLEAQKRGATLIVVDPRFNRTAKVADIYAPVRPGTDIGYLGAIVKYIIDNELYDETYVREHTNAQFKVNPDFNLDRKSTRLNSSHVSTSYAVFCLKKKIKPQPLKNKH